MKAREGGSDVSHAATCVHASPPLLHLPAAPQLSPLGHPGFYQGALITLTWNEPSGSAGHQVLPELLVRAPHEAGQ